MTAQPLTVTDQGSVRILTMTGEPRRGNPMSAELATRSAPAITFAREVLFEATEGPLRQSLRIERLPAALVIGTPEAQERSGAFLNRRG